MGPHNLIFRPRMCTVKVVGQAKRQSESLIGMAGLTNTGLSFSTQPKCQTESSFATVLGSDIHAGLFQSEYLTDALMSALVKADIQDRVDRKIEGSLTVRSGPYAYLERSAPLVIFWILVF